MEIIEEHICFDGVLKIVKHPSNVLSCDMTFSVFIPKNIDLSNASVVMFLSGLTCTHENFTTKAGAYQKAAELGLVIVAPDTSPRGKHVPDDSDSYDFGKGAGFYINATAQPWVKHYQMEHYIAVELPNILASEFSLKTDKMGISGHSMGGHGALTLHLKYPDKFISASAFSPIVAPSQVPWGRKDFARYLGGNKEEWKHHDATELMKNARNRGQFSEILIDQGTNDQFLEEQLKPELFVQACKETQQALNLRLQEGYDHSYYFIQSFVDDHLLHHSKILNKV